MDSLKVSDAAAGAVATHPRVTLEDIEGAIAAVYYFNAHDAVAATKPAAQPLSDQLKRLTVCMMVMSNGYVVIGESAAGDRGKLQSRLGRKLAYENAVRQLWPLMGFALRDKLAAAQA
jgi:hypothetical protein